MDREKVREEAKQLMDEFFGEISSLQSVDIVDSPAGGPGTRTPQKECRDALSTRELLKNAPKKNDSFIIAERKAW